LYVWATTNLSKQLDELTRNLATKSGQLTTSFAQLSAVTVDFIAEQAAQAGKVTVDSKALAEDALRALNSSYLLNRASTIGLLGNQIPDSADATGASGRPPPDPRIEWSRSYTNASDLVRTATGEALRVQGTANLISGMSLSLFLPILLGAIGAVAYVIRSISDQIRTFTFSSSSPIRT
jgi:hypothetical protein